MIFLKVKHDFFASSTKLNFMKQFYCNELTQADMTDLSLCSLQKQLRLEEETLTSLIYLF